MNKRVRLGGMGAFCLLCVIILLLGMSLGSSGIGLNTTASVILEKLTGLQTGAAPDKAQAAIVWELRVPRALLAFLVGAALAVSGVITQSVLRNPLASPYTMGVSAGASLSAALYMAVGVLLPVAGRLGLPFAGFVGGLVTILLVMLLASAMDKLLSVHTLILTGMVFSLFISAVLTVILVLFRENLQQVLLWQMGSFAMRGWTYPAVMLPFLLVGLVIALAFSKEMDILAFGEQAAMSVGVSTVSVKWILLLISAFLAGAAVSLSGIIGFVDLIAPHMARKLFGPEHKVLLPMSALCGGALMVLSDLAARTILPPLELPVGAVTALIGAPFFAGLFLRNHKRQGKGKAC